MQQDNVECRASSAANEQRSDDLEFWELEPRVVWSWTVDKLEYPADCIVSEGSTRQPILKILAKPGVKQYRKVSGRHYCPVHLPNFFPTWRTPVNKGSATTTLNSVENLLGLR
ncbi:hypothetical protein J6590_048359 [Homalodisca vitripennis]|nr:hypothetical protein J6590_048359 [Homalodisca vitripennis]